MSLRTNGEGNSSSGITSRTNIIVSQSAEPTQKNLHFTNNSSSVYQDNTKKEFFPMIPGSGGIEENTFINNLAESNGIFLIYLSLLF